MKPYNRQPAIQLLTKQTRVFVLAFLSILSLVSCKKLNNPKSDGIQPAITTKSDPSPRALPAPGSTASDTHDSRIPITDQLVNQVKASTLYDFEKEELLNILTSLQEDPKTNKPLRKVDTIDYMLAFDYALDLADPTILQALLQRKNKVAGEVDTGFLLRKAMIHKNQVGLQALLKLGVENVASSLDKGLLMYAIENKAPVEHIKTLLDPQVNPHALDLVDAKIVQVALKQALESQDSDETSQETLLALLNASESFLSSKLTDKQIIQLIGEFTCIAHKELLFHKFLTWLIAKTDKHRIKNLMDKKLPEYKNRSIYNLLQMGYFYGKSKQVFMDLGLL